MPAMTTQAPEALADATAQAEGLAALPGYLFIAKDDDGYGNPVFCADKAAVAIQVRDHMFVSTVDLDEDEVEQYEGTAAELIENGFVKFEGDPGFTLYRLRDGSDVAAQAKRKARLLEREVQAALSSRGAGSAQRPGVPQSVSVAISAYGDARADDDGTSAERLGECISSIRDAMAAASSSVLGAGGGGNSLHDLMQGMSISVDVGTDDAGAERRYFGTVTEVMDDPAEKGGVMLLVQDAEPNFTPSPADTDLLAALDRIGKAAVHHHTGCEDGPLKRMPPELREAIVASQPLIAAAKLTAGGKAAS